MLESYNGFIKKMILSMHKLLDDLKWQIEAGIDEAGRGPMLGRVYAGACILPKDASFNHLLLKDSKKYSSKRLLLNAYNYIKENAISHSFGFIEADEIDNINIRQSTFKAMHIAINNLSVKPQHLIVDGNSFKPYTKITELGFNIIPHTCIEGGDNIYTPIAAASIIAKVERDKYIEELCDQYPYLEQWDIRNSKGYGTKNHIEGIRKYGITPWHRQSFNICKGRVVNKKFILN